MTTERYDVLAVNITTGLVEVKKSATELSAEDTVAILGWYERHLWSPAVFYTSCPTGTYKDGDHYPKEEA